MLVVSHHRSDGLSDRLAEMQLPSAFVGRPWTCADRLSYVDTDNVEGGRLATQALLDRGCRRIGTVAVATGDFTEEGGAAATRELLERHPDVDGIFVASDLMAIGALRVLQESGRTVPDDVALVGYDDIGVAERTTPPLTTVSNPTRELATRATRMLLDAVGDGASTPLRLIVTPTLVRRESA